MVESEVGLGVGSELVKTCEEIRNQCASTHATCKERCDGLEDIVERIFCHGRCRATPGGTAKISATRSLGLKKMAFTAHLAKFI